MMVFFGACDNGQADQIKSKSMPGIASENAKSSTGIMDEVLNAGEKLAKQRCQNCHGEHGELADDGKPILAGQHTPYLIYAMRSYLDDTRKIVEMKKVLLGLTGSDLHNLAAFYANQTTDWKSSLKTASLPDNTISPRDIKAGKRKSKSCTGCHGLNGHSQLPGIPSLAGLPYNYIKRSINSYFDGSRVEKKTMIKFFRNTFSKKDIHQLAAYYSNQKPLRSKLPVNHGSRKAGEKIAAKICVGCHGLNGNSGSPEIPSLSAQNANYLNKAMIYYKSGMRKENRMKNAVAGLSHGDITDLAAYFARQTPKKIRYENPGQGTAFDPVGQGKSIASACAGCHGEDGNSTVPNTPILAGLQPAYITAALQAYKQGERNHETMKGFASMLTHQNIEKVSLYFAVQNPLPTKSVFYADAVTGKKVAQACTTCHGEKGNSSQTKTPSLAGQDPSYLEAALRLYKTGQRKNKAMLDVANKLQDNDFKNLAAYFASQTRQKQKVKIPESPEALAQRCNRCHDKNGHSTNPAIPRIASQNETYLIKALLAYKHKDREQSTMYAMASILSDLEITAIAKYYASKR